MTTAYPNDDDGNLLRRVAASGCDMSKPIDVHFQVAAPDEAAAQQIAEEASTTGYRAHVYGSSATAWKCQCTRSMIATHASIADARLVLGAVASSVGGRVVRWGTYGRGKKYMASGSPPDTGIRRWYQYSLRALLTGVTAMCVVLGMFYTAASSRFSWDARALATLAGLLICGATIGAAVGYAEEPEHGSLIGRRAFLGAMLFAGIALLGVIAVLVTIIAIFWDFRVAG